MNTTNTNGNGEIKTLLQAVVYFSDLNAAHDFFAKMRWPDGPVCPRCGSTDVGYSPKYRRFECSHSHDGRQFTVKTGTIMEDSPLGLDKWAAAFWLEVNAKNSISSYEIHRALGLTQKTAWFMLHRIRLAVKSNSFEKMGGAGSIIEADETVVGGLKANMHKSKRDKMAKGTGMTGKTVVMGLLERHSEKKQSTVRTEVLAGNVNRETLHPIIHKHVEPGSQLFTDAHGGYRGLDPIFIHKFIDHAEKYVEGAVHTNGIENFWSLFKRCIKGTHVSIDPFHLFAYVDSESFRFNNRDLHDGQRFALALRGMSGKRLTYKALIGASEGAPGAGKGEEFRGLPN
ncbi:MAG: IS1595 family transposase [Tepidisphaeraceae bacterium]